MNEKIQLLKADIDADLAEIAAIYDKLASYPIPLSDPEKVIVVGYYLHNLYTAFEYLCVLVATAFENQISDRSQWHSLLLRRMTQEIEAIRPRLFSHEAYDCLDELRRFRHVFRSAYSITLDADRLELVLKKAKQLQSLHLTDITVFKQFLDSL